MNRLKDTVAFLTGGGAGIAKASALEFAKEGAKVAIVDINAKVGQRAEQEMKAAGGEVIFGEADVTQDAEVKQAIDTAVAKFGKLNVLVNCAGGSVLEDVPVHEMSLDIWHKTINLNLLHPFLVCKHSIPHLMKSGGGSIVNFSSMVGMVGMYRPAYSKCMRATSKALAVLLTCTCAAAHAQTPARFPVKAIRVVVPYPAGGPTDMTARTLAPRMSEALGQQIVIDNRAGGSTIIGTEMVARAPADGHALLLVTSTIAVSPSTFKKLPYDVTRDLVPVTQVIATPFALLTHPALPVRSTADLVALVRARPGQLHYPTSGVGTSNHLAIVLLSQLAKIEPVHVPYKGTAPGIVDLIAGHVQFSFNNPMTSLPLVNAGKLRVLATTGAQRLAILPKLPTVAETVPGYEAGNWHSLFAPGGTPRETVARLHAEVARALAAPDVRTRLLDGGAQIVGSSPEEFAAYFKAEIAKWAQTVKVAKIQVE